MSCVRHAINKVKQAIPQAVLEKAFAPREMRMFQFTTFNLDKEIENKVIRSIVLPDCNVVGGKEVVVLIGDLPREISGNEVVIRIPKSRTQNRSIVSITDISFSSVNNGAFYPSSYVGNYSQSTNRNDTSAMMGAMKNMVAALDNIPLTGTSSAELIGENTLLIQNNIFITSNTMARVVVEYDDQLSNISPRSWNAFAQLVEHATKMKIYNELAIRMDTAELQAGFNLGIFKELVSEYKDSAENYKTYLRETWQKIALMNDRPRYERFIKSVLGGQFK